jgi:hypothetical protein
MITLIIIQNLSNIFFCNFLFICFHNNNHNHKYIIIIIDYTGLLIPELVRRGFLLLIRIALKEEVRIPSSSPSSSPPSRNFEMQRRPQMLGVGWLLFTGVSVCKWPTPTSPLWYSETPKRGRCCVGDNNNDNNNLVRDTSPLHLCTYYYLVSWILAKFSPSFMDFFSFQGVLMFAVYPRGIIICSIIIIIIFTYYYSSLIIIIIIIMTLI